MNFEVNNSGITVIGRDGGTLSLDGKRTVLALGTFDGVHIAHKALLDRAVMLKDELCADLCGAFCFAESPVSVLRGIHVPQISTPKEKLELMFEEGLDFVAICDFSAVRDTSADDFVLNVIKQRLGGIGAVCGFDHRFGRGGAGNAQLLGDILGEGNVVMLPEIKLCGVTVSSSAIRSYLADGNI